jgi:hypothetical protein
MLHRVLDGAGLTHCLLYGFCLVWAWFRVSAPCLNGAAGNAAMRLTIQHHNPKGVWWEGDASVPTIWNNGK